MDPKEKKENEEQAYSVNTPEVPAPEVTDAGLTAADADGPGPHPPRGKDEEDD